MTILEGLLYSLLGVSIVFFGLILLIVVIKILTKILGTPKKKKEESAAAPAPIVEKIPAPGSAGEIKLNNVPPRTAAMLMAITANKMGVPINQLRFISIKCIDE